MKPGLDSTALTLLTTSGQFLIGDLYTITLRSGATTYYTNLDFSVTYSGHTFVANSLRFDGLKFKLAVGWQVDEQDLKISAYPIDNISGALFIAGVEQGLLDGATIKRERAFWAVASGIPFADYQQAPAGVITLFTGLVSNVGKIGRTTVEMKLKSPMKYLDIDMPRNAYTPGCAWVLYDSNCTVDRGSFTASYTITAVVNSTQLTVASIGSPTGADGLPYYLQGRMLFTSGANNGLQTLIGNNDSTNFFLQYPLNVLPTVGDTFDASAGCAHTPGTCTSKFSNLVNFRGFPRVPPVVISL